MMWLAGCLTQWHIETNMSTCDEAFGSINWIKDPEILSVCVFRLLHAFFLTKDAVIWKPLGNFLSHGMLSLSVSLCNWTLVSFVVDGQRLSVAAAWLVSVC